MEAILTVENGDVRGGGVANSSGRFTATVTGL